MRHLAALLFVCLGIGSGAIQVFWSGGPSGSARPASAASDQQVDPRAPAI